MTDETQGPEADINILRRAGWVRDGVISELRKMVGQLKRNETETRAQHVREVTILRGEIISLNEKIGGLNKEVQEANRKRDEAIQQRDTLEKSVMAVVSQALEPKGATADLGGDKATSVEDAAGSLECDTTTSEVEQRDGGQRPVEHPVEGRPLEEPPVEEHPVEGRPIEGHPVRSVEEQTRKGDVPRHVVRVHTKTC